MFLVAGVVKAVERSVPVLPWVEIGLGGLLVAQVALPWTAWAAAGLLSGFTAWLLTHRGVPCACFGAWSRRPVGWGAVGRNVVLIAMAVATAWSH